MCDVPFAQQMRANAPPNFRLSNKSPIILCQLTSIFVFLDAIFRKVLNRHEYVLVLIVLRLFVLKVIQAILEK